MALETRPTEKVSPAPTYARDSDFGFWPQCLSRRRTGRPDRWRSKWDYSFRVGQTGALSVSIFRTAKAAYFVARSRRCFVDRDTERGACPSAPRKARCIYPGRRPFWHSYSEPTRRSRRECMGGDCEWTGSLPRIPDYNDWQEARNLQFQYYVPTGGSRWHRLDRNDGRPQQVEPRTSDDISQAGRHGCSRRSARG